MRSVYRNGSIGANTKLRGKIQKFLSCGCCDMRNFKWPELWKQAAKEIKIVDWCSTGRWGSW